MDFNQLMSRMRELDQPTQEACGDRMPGPIVAPGAPDTPPPSMTVNLNAHGMSDIESMMKLFQKVNPDMMPQTPAPMPMLSTPPSISSISPDAKPINKLLPDLSDEPSSMEPDAPEGPTPDAMKLPPEHDKDHDIVKTLDKDGDGDHDMDDHEVDQEPKDDEEDKKEAYANQPDEAEYEMDKTIFGGNDLHREKGSYPKVAGGDNPMQKVKEAGDLRAQIRAELLQRLAEAKSK